MRLKLQAAAQKAAENPVARALMQRAETQLRLEQLRRENRIGGVAPAVYDGELCDERGRPYDPAIARQRAIDAAAIPPRVSETLGDTKK